MSTTIDQRVVEMRFDNQHFEKNVGTTLSTLDKLKQSLKLTDASKGLENVASAADKVSLKFNAMYAFTDEWVRDWSRQIKHMSENFVKALTIDPIRTGLSEYETQLNSVQTILANTQSKGSTIEDVNAALDELNKYADQTIYNFTEMTRNIGTFTAAGVDLETSTAAIKGIANLAAASGSTSQQASTAMYQLSQALATGTVRLQDWNSVVNAGMGGELFQNALKRTARKQGIDVDGLIAQYGSFRESLTRGEWLTTDVLTETLNQFTMAAEEGSEEWNNFKASLQDQGYSADEADEILKMANTATEAATKVKTSTQLWDVMKEAAQSGWAQTWEIIFGDLEEAKAFFTPIADFFTGENGIITKMSDFRNNFLTKALGNPFEGFLEKLDGVITPVEKLTTGIADLGDITKRVISGEFGNAEKRWNKLTELGYDWKHVQNLVNEELGCSFRRLTDAEEGTEEYTKAQADLTEQISKLTDAELEALGFTNSEIKTLRTLQKQSEETGKSIGELASNMDGRTLLIDSFGRIAKSIIDICSAIKTAFFDAFPPPDGTGLYNLILSFDELSKKLVVGEDTLDNLTRTFKGLFAAIDIVTTIIGGGFKIAFKVVSKIISALAKALGWTTDNVLEATASIGDMVVAVRDFIDSKITKGIEYMVDIFIEMAKAVKDTIDAFMALPEVEDVIGNIKQSFLDIAKYILDGLQNGLESITEPALQPIKELGLKIVSTIKDILGIESPSTVFFEIGTNIIQGLVNGLLSGIRFVLKMFVDFGSAIVNAFKNSNVDFSFLDVIKEKLNAFKDFVMGFDYQSLLAIVPIGIIVVLVAKMSKAIGIIADGIDGVNDVIENFAKIEKAAKNFINAKAFESAASAIKTLATAILILAVSVGILTLVDQDKMWNAVGVIVVLAGTLALLSLAIGKMSNSSVKLDKNGFAIDGMKTALLGIVASLLIMAVVVKIIGSMDPDQFNQGMLGLVGAMGALAIFLVVCLAVTKGRSMLTMEKLGSMMIKMATTMILMAVVCKLAAGLSPTEMLIGAGFAAAFVLFIKLLTWATTIDGGKKIADLGKLLLSISVSMMLMIGVCKLAGTLTPDEMKKGAGFALAFVGFVWILRLVTETTSDKKTAQLAGLIIAISVSLLLLVGVCKLVGFLEPEDMKKGALFAAGFVALIYVLKTVTTISSEQETAKLAGTIIAMAAAIGIMAGIAVLLGMVPIDMLAKGVIAVSLLGLVMASMIRATKGATKCIGNIIAMTIAIAIMAGAVVVLTSLDTVKMATSAAALVALMASFAIILKMAGTGIFSGKGILTIAALTLVVAALAGIIYLLSGLPVESTIKIAASLSVLLLAMSGACAILSFTGPAAMAALPVMAALTIIVGILALILTALSGLPVEATFSNTITLSILLLALSGACVILATVGAAAPAALAGAGALVGVIGIIGTVIVAIGALMENFPMLEQFLDKGIDILVKLGYGLGEAVGAIIGGFAAGITAGLPEIGTNLSLFMLNATPFIVGAKMLDESTCNGVLALAKCILALTAADVIDGLTSWLTGGTSFADFGKQLAEFAPHLVEFANLTGGLDGEKLKNSAEAAKALAEMAGALPNEGGVLGWFMGENDMETFGTNLESFGKSLVKYSKSVDGVNTEAIETSVGAANSLVEMAKKVPNDGGVFGWFMGNNDLATFGENIESFGTSLKNYGDSVTDINTESIANSVKAASSIVKLQSSLEDMGGIIDWFTGKDDLATFGNNLAKFGGSLVKYSNSIVTLSVSTMSSVTTELDRIINLAGRVDKTDIDNVESLGSSLKTLGEEGITQFVKMFEGSYDEAKTTIETYIDKAVAGVDSKKSAFKLKFTLLIAEVVRALNTCISQFVDLGEDFGDGLIRGINNKKIAAYNAGKALGKEAVRGEKEGQDSNSPSKLTFQAGKWLGEGLINGIEAMSKKVYNAGHSLGDMAANTMTSTASMIADAINTDIDAQPTIRPVLDLSDIAAGANSINGMFGSSTLGVLATANGINVAMNSRSQNGTNNDVIAAINKLDKHLDNVGGTSYNINGITYDDGSNISEAVKTLVRAARVERRM